MWILESQRSAYVLGVFPEGGLQHLWWGPRLTDPSDYPTPGAHPEHQAGGINAGFVPEEYPAWGGMRFTNPCLKLTYADGGRDLPLGYRDHRITGDALAVALADPYEPYGLSVTLHYQIVWAHDLVVRWAEITNGGTAPLDLEVALSAAWNLPPDRYALWHLHGQWGAETQIEQQVLAVSATVTLESRRGQTSHVANPFFALGAAGRVEEEQGRVWFGALAWSGNWRIAVQSTPAWTQITGGISDFDFRWRLAPGESFHTPPFVGGYANDGLGGASRRLHRYQREEVLPSSGRWQPVLYNSWEATTFHVTPEEQMVLAKRAAALGVELFVVDDGWFGTRDNSHRGLGDWFPSPTKFPQGLGPLIAGVQDLGMDFGLWVEPEMVNPDSDLYRAHPDWILHFPHRTPSQHRNQWVLNFARDDVRAYILEILDGLLTQNPIAFIKWDHNRPFSEPGWPDAPAIHQREVWVRHVLGVYEILDRLRALHPGVIFETCAGGGGRVDLGILARTDQAWASDNTDPFDRLRIQEGFTAAYAPRAMVSWVTRSPTWAHGRHVSLDFRFHVSMAGTLGIGDDIRNWSPEEMRRAAELVALYKEIRPLVQGGDLYRIRSPREGSETALCYVAEDRSAAVVFVYQHHTGPLHPARSIVSVRIPGLDPSAHYRVSAERVRLFGGASLHDRPVSGSALAEVGLCVEGLDADYASAIVQLHRI